MPAYLEIASKRLYRSMSEADAKQLGPSIRDPDLSAVEGWPARYWQIDGETVSLMSQAERDQVDAQLAEDRIAREVSETEAGVLKALALVMLDEINRLRQAAGLEPRTVTQLRAAMKEKLRG